MKKRLSEQENRERIETIHTAADNTTGRNESKVMAKEGKQLRVKQYKQNRIFQNNKITFYQHLVQSAQEKIQNWRKRIKIILE